MKRMGWVFAGAAMLALPSVAPAQSSLEKMMRGGPILSAKKLKKAIAKAEAFPLGSSQNPIRAHFPPGQRGYLDRLRCADGSAPNYARSGNVGPGVYSSIVDSYVVNCGAAAPGEVNIQMDMYHPGHVEMRAVEGFTLVAPGTPKPLIAPPAEIKS